MSVTTAYMGLTAWDQGGDGYDHTQLASNFLALDAHDHSTGKGKQISASGIADSSITSAKIADNAIIANKILDGVISQVKLANNSVGSAQIIDGSITGADIADGSITNTELDPSINPLGKVIMWFRVDPSVALPSGYEHLDGRPWSAVPNTLGPGGSNWTTGNMPDTRNRFPLGAALSGTGSTPDLPPNIGQVGGAMTIDLTHSHAGGSHTHTVPSHTHQISSQPPHRHKFVTRIWDSNGNGIGYTLADPRQRGSAVPSSAGTRQSLYIPDLNRDERQGEDVAAPMASEIYVDAGSGTDLVSQPAHNHGGITGNTSLTTNASSAFNTDPALSNNIDHRNAYVGFLFLIRAI